MQPLAVVDLFDEGADLLAGIVDVAIVSSVISSCLSVFMKLSALALS